VTHITVLIQMNSDAEENNWLAAHQITSDLLQMLHSHITRLTSV